MKAVEALYEEYIVMPNMRAHMYRVTAVASVICDHFNGLLDRKSIISACLLHDIGKIVALDPIMPKMTKPRGEDYWINIQRSLIEKYKTHDEHTATLAMALEIGASLHTLELIHSSGFFNAHLVNDSGEFEKMIVLYSDMRVSPDGVTTLQARLDDLSVRYKDNPRTIKGRAKDEIHEAIFAIEKQIFSHTDIQPEFISDLVCDPIIPTLSKISPQA